MVRTEEIVLNGQEHEVETATLTLLAHGGLAEIEVPGRVRIGPDDTVALFNAMSGALWRAAWGHH
jgi:hypothetical protein